MQRSLLRTLLLLLFLMLSIPSAGLQAHTAPAIQHLALLDDQDIYYADDTAITLHTHTNWLAVATDPLKPSSFSTNSELAQSKLIHQLSPTLQIVELRKSSIPIAQVLQSTAQNDAVAWTSPVFIGPNGGWMVATAEVIVQVQPQTDPTDLLNDPRFTSMRPLDGTDDQYVLTIAAGGGRAALAVARNLASDPRLRWASPNFFQEYRRTFSPNDPLISDEWYLNNTGQRGGTVDADADVFEAWDITAGGSSAITIAVIDDGMEYSHPDLAANLFVNAGEIAGNSIDDDLNGWIDDRNGWDFTTNQASLIVGDNNPAADSANDEHATAVAGVAAASGNNGIGVAGVAYNARILPVRIFGATGNSTSDSNIASAIYYAAGRTRTGVGTWPAADILNNSWGGGSSSSAITTALTWATNNGRNGRGTPAVFASGNQAQVTVSYPANLATSNPGVIAVGATNDDDLRSIYSNYGSALDVVAPSSDTRSGTFGIVTVDRVGTNGYNAGDYGTNGDFGGTSSATPLVAGIVALMLSQDATLTAAQVRGLLRNTTDLVGPVPYTNGRNNEYGYGRVNAASAVQSIGSAEIQLLDGATNIPNAGAILIDSNAGQTTQKTLLIRNQGTAVLSLANLNLTGTDFSLITGFADTSLSIGESTTVVIGFSRSSAGNSSGSLSFSSNDANEASFSISLSGATTLPSIAGTVYEDIDLDGTHTIGDQPLASWIVYLDQDADGQYDPGSFTNATAQAIPDGDASGLSSSIVISGTQVPITDLNIRLNINHGYVGDLQIELVSPGGTTIVLVDQRGASGVNFDMTMLDDEASGSIATITPAGAPYAASYKPEQPLSAFDGLPINGIWVLRVRDLAAQDIGSLVSWSLIFSTSGEPITITDSQGNYAFSGLAAGSYRVHTLVHNGWIRTQPNTVGYTIPLAVGGSSLENDFGNTRDLSILPYKVALPRVVRP